MLQVTCSTDTKYPNNRLKRLLLILNSLHQEGKEKMFQQARVSERPFQWKLPIWIAWSRSAKSNPQKHSERNRLTRLKNSARFTETSLSAKVSLHNDRTKFLTGSCCYIRAVKSCPTRLWFLNLQVNKSLMWGKKTWLTSKISSSSTCLTIKLILNGLKTSRLSKKLICNTISFRMLSFKRETLKSCRFYI